VSSTRDAQLQRFHRLGPWVLGGSAVGVAIIYEIAKSHRVSRDEVIVFLVLVPSIVLHEVSHGFVANLCGDDTAKRAGRLTLNPLKHVDPVGTILLPILLIATLHTAFGWAKPVPVSVNRLRHPRNQAVLVGLAGPAVNIVLALVGGYALHLFTGGGATLSSDLNAWPLGYEILYLFGYANVIIAAFNLIPIPPLDGSAVVERLLPARLLPDYYRIRSLFLILVIFLVLADQSLLNPLFDHVQTVFDWIAFRPCSPGIVSGICR